MRKKNSPRNLDGHCPRCFFRQEVCVCPVTPRLQTRTRVVIVRHVLERHRTSNTGRLAALALPNCEILDYGDGREVFDDRALRAPGAWLLYPDRPSAFTPAEPPSQIVVLDATWRQSRRMYRKIDALRGMPTLALPEPAQARARLRQPTHSDGVSTLEAIAAALGMVEGPECSEPLFRFFDEAVRRALSLREGRPEVRRLAGLD